MTEGLRLAELLCARFSHDLSGLLGSLTGVLELIAEAVPKAKGGIEEEVGLATETAAELMNRLRLLRAAWGGVNDPLSVEALRTLAGGAIGGRRLAINLDGLPAGAELDPPMARAALNLLLLGAEALPRGGTLALAGDPATHLLARVEGPDAAWPPGLAASLSGEDAAWAALDTPRALQAPLTALIAAASGLKLSLLLAPGNAAAPPPLMLSR
ncbi:MAG: hypothetical protein JSR21_04700 [Proteobacteria bacterium]|nr:hypothetical protein [Pseudomonadota bacterium]